MKNTPIVYGLFAALILSGCGLLESSNIKPLAAAITGASPTPDSTPIPRIQAAIHLTIDGSERTIRNLAYLGNPTIPGEDQTRRFWVLGDDSIHAASQMSAIINIVTTGKSVRADELTADDLASCDFQLFSDRAWQNVGKPLSFRLTAHGTTADIYLKARFQSGDLGPITGELTVVGIPN